VKYFALTKFFTPIIVVITKNVNDKYKKIWRIVLNQLWIKYLLTRKINTIVIINEIVINSTSCNAKLNIRFDLKCFEMECTNTYILCLKLLK